MLELHTLARGDAVVSHTINLYRVFEHQGILVMTESRDRQAAPEEAGYRNRFLGWKLVGVLALVVVGIASVSAVVDWLFLAGIIDVYE